VGTAVTKVVKTDDRRKGNGFPGLRVDTDDSTKDKIVGCLKPIMDTMDPSFNLEDDDVTDSTQTLFGLVSNKLQFDGTWCVQSPSCKQQVHTCTFGSTSSGRLCGRAPSATLHFLAPFLVPFLEPLLKNPKRTKQATVKQYQRALCRVHPNNGCAGNAHALDHTPTMIET
jgi:hypothetical protein